MSPAARRHNVPARTRFDAAYARSNERAGGARARVLVVLGLTVAALSLTTAPALSATEGTTLSEAQRARALQRVQEREERRAQRIAEVEKLRRQRLEETLRARARTREKREEAGGKRHTPHGFVDITCATITWHFENFSSGTHTIVETTSIDGTHLPPVLFTFTGPTASNETPVGAGPPVHRIDAFAKWVDQGVHGGWDIDSRRTCGTGHPGASYAIEKRQKILEGSGGFVPTPLTGEVGQTIAYQIVVTNTGTEFLVMSDFIDPHCDPGTIKGGLLGPLGPGESARFSCTHVITPADQEAGSYANTAVVTGTPFGGGEEKRQETNTVTVTVPKTPPSEEPKKTHGSGEETKQTNGAPGVGEAAGTTGVLGTTASVQGKQGTLAATASVPALLGRPHGCARSSFVVSVRSKGVRSVTFYLDNHKLKKLMYKNARAGKLSVRVQTARLRVGVHRLKARITMNRLTASAKAVIATRSMTFARCASATLSPRFAG